MSLTPRPVEAAAGELVAAGFGAVAAVRRGRAVHTIGCSFHGSVRLTPAAEARWGGAVGHAIVRFSKGGGFPEPLPDILGLGVRLGLDGRPGTPIDLLVASSLARPGLRHLLIPARRFERPFFSSLTPYDTADGLRLYGGEVEGPPGETLTLDALRAGKVRPTRVVIVVATLTGAWETVGSITIADRVDPEASEALRFNPWHTTDPFRPVGAFNRVRDRAYLASQRARFAAVRPVRAEDAPTVAGR